MRVLLAYLFRLVKRTLSRLNARPANHTPQSKPEPAMWPALAPDTPVEAPLRQSPSPPASRRLPPELLLYIIATSSATSATADPEPLDGSSSYPRVRPKPEFASLSGLNGSCRMYHEAVQKAWYYVLVIREKNDWKIVEELKIASYVREIRVLSPALGRWVPHDVFMSFTQLHTAYIDAHNDFELNESQPVTATSLPVDTEASPIGRYRILAPCLPSSLRRLYVTNAHGPDISIIQTLRSCCPQLQDLSISRCSLFSPRLRSSDTKNMTCTFWNRFPSDHDSYFANEGIEDYAASLARELKQLDNLLSLHMGLYLTPHEAISTHIRDHHHLKHEGDSFWDSPCVICSDQFRGQTCNAEMAANNVLFGQLPHLENISWASFFTTSRLDPVCYTRNSETYAQGYHIVGCERR
ncbi:hypothetical protein FRC12_017961 [Ceratobasidium sp. 428]|nr:hypothetical protein FRC12_017961 [Ceratobasidium sp. 428]